MPKIYLFKKRDVEAEEELSYQAFDIFREFRRKIDDSADHLLDESLPMDIAVENGIQIKDEFGSVVFGVKHADKVKVEALLEKSRLIELYTDTVRIRIERGRDADIDNGISIMINGEGLDKALDTYGYKFCKEQISILDSIVEKEIGPVHK